MAERVGGVYYDIDLNDKPLRAGARNINKELDEMQEQMRRVDKLGNIALAGVAALAGTVAAGIGMATQAFVGFEDNLANVRKTVGLTAEQTEQLGESLLAMSRTTRTSADELIKIATVGGQLGVGEKDILGFTDAVNKLSVALGDEFLGGAEQITSEVGILRNLFNDIKTDRIDQDLLHIGNALNVLGASGIATAPVITDFATRIAGLTGGLGVSAGDILGLSAALEALGVNAERGGSNVGRIFNIIAKDSTKIAKALKLDVREFTKLVNTDINEAFLTVAKRVRELGTENTAFSKLLDEIGLDAVGASEVLQKVGGAIDLVTQEQKRATDSLTAQNSVMDEYNTKNDTTQGKIQQLGNRFNELFVNLGKDLSPVIDSVIGELTRVVDSITAEGGLLAVFNNIKESAPLAIEAVAAAIGLVLLPKLASAAIAVAGLASAFAPFLAGGAIIGGTLEISRQMANWNEEIKNQIDSAIKIYELQQNKLPSITDQTAVRVNESIQKLFEQGNEETAKSAQSTLRNMYSKAQDEIAAGNYDAAQEIVSNMQSFNQQLKTILETGQESFREVVKGGAQSLVSEYGNAFTQITSQAKETRKTLNDLMNPQKRFSPSMVDLVNAGLDKIQDAYSSMYASVTQLTARGRETLMSTVASIDNTVSNKTTTIAEAPTVVNLNLTGALARSRGELREIARDMVEALDEDLVARGKTPLIKTLV